MGITTWGPGGTAELGKRKFQGTKVQEEEETHRERGQGKTVIL